MQRLQLPAVNTVDQSNLVGGNGAGFGTFAAVRARGQVFVPTISTFSTLAFQQNGLGTTDLLVTLTNVDQTSLLPIGSPLATWVIPFASLTTTLTTYTLTPAYTNMVPGTAYAFYLQPQLNGVYTDSYRDLNMSVANPYTSGVEITNTNGTWAQETILDMVFQTGAAAFSGRNAASGRVAAAPRFDLYSPPNVLVQPVNTAKPRGVAMSGLEFGSGYGGTLNTSYFESSAATYNYFGAKGFNTARIAFTWERLQPTLNGNLDATYAGYLDEQIAKCKAAGMKAILDCHNYGRRKVVADGGITENFTENPLINLNYPYADYNSNGFIVLRNYGEAFFGTVTNPVSSNGYTIGFNMKFNSRDDTFGGEGFAIRPMRTDANNYYEFYADLADNTWTLSKVVATTKTTLATGSKVWGTTNTYAVLIDVNQGTNGKINVSINGTALYTSNSVNTDAALTHGQVSFFPSGVHVQVDTMVLNVNGDTSSGGVQNFIIGSTQLTTAHLANLWTKIATRYVSETGVYGYDIMNEPHDMTVPTTSSNFNTTATVTLMHQAAINAIRAVDTNKYIFCEIDQWAGAQNFVTNYGSNPVPWLTDSANKLAYSFHYYMDNDHSGTYAQAFASSNNTNISGDITPILSWAQGRSVNIHCGEYGVPNQSAWQVCLTTFFNLMNTYGAWANHWAAGDAYTAITVIQPTNNYATDALQMAIVGAAGNLGTF